MADLAELGHGDLGRGRDYRVSDLSACHTARSIAMPLGRAVDRRMHGGVTDRLWFGDLGLSIERTMLHAATGRIVEMGGPIGILANRLIRTAVGAGAAVTVSGPRCFR